MKETELRYKTQDGYRSILRANARALWTGEWDFLDFYAGMQSAINRGFRQAWEEGMQKYGLTLNDQNAAERTRLQQEINHETTFIEGAADFIETHSREAGGKLEASLQRIEQWVAAYNRIRQLATAMAAKDKPLIWTLGIAEHCESCLKLAGKVKRGSYWQAHVTPKDWDKLECRKGCQCDLLPTDQPLSKGPLPKLP